MKKKNNAILNERDLKGEILSAIRDENRTVPLKEILEDYHYKDVSGILDELSEPELCRLFTELGAKDTADILSYLDNADEYLSPLTPEISAAIIESMDADDATEALEHMDEEIRRRILSLIKDNEAKTEIDLIRSYDSDEFGSRMSTEFICFKRDASVKEAMRILISDAPENDNIYTLFTVNSDGSFYGAISLKDLIAAREGESLEDIICTAFPYVYDNDIISENIQRVRGYLEDLIPVLSGKDRSILGVITSADITDMIDEERGDDYAKLAALSEEEEENESLFRSIKKRAPWLIILLFLGLTVSSVVGLFEDVVNELPLIVAFQSLILGMAGNVGTQSLAVTVRILGGEQTHRVKKYFKAVAKETRIALLNGAVLGGVSFITVASYLLFLGGYPAAFALSVSGCVGAAMCISMAISGFTGASIPICLHLLGTDPAIASGPLITTVNDLAAVISYYGLAWLLLLRI